MNIIQRKLRGKHECKIEATETFKSARMHTLQTTIEGLCDKRKALPSKDRKQQLLLLLCCWHHDSWLITRLNAVLVLQSLKRELVKYVAWIITGPLRWPARCQESENKSCWTDYEFINSTDNQCGYKDTWRGLKGQRQQIWR